MGRPVIYESEMDELRFLSEIEIGYLRVGDESLKKMLMTRAKMFHKMFAAWVEFEPKTSTFKHLSRMEWKSKIYPILNLQFKLKDEQIKGVIDLFWQRVDLPKKGIKRD